MLLDKVINEGDDNQSSFRLSNENDNDIGHLDEHEAYISTDQNVDIFDNSVNFESVTRLNEMDLLTKPSDPAN